MARNCRGQTGAGLNSSERKHGGPSPSPRPARFWRQIGLVGASTSLSLCLQNWQQNSKESSAPEFARSAPEAARSLPIAARSSKLTRIHRPFEPRYSPCSMLYCCCWAVTCWAACLSSSAVSTRADTSEGSAGEIRFAATEFACCCCWALSSWPLGCTAKLGMVTAPVEAAAAAAAAATAARAAGDWNSWAPFEIGAVGLRVGCCGCSDCACCCCWLAAWGRAPELELAGWPPSASRPTRAATRSASPLGLPGANMLPLDWSS